MKKQIIIAAIVLGASPAMAQNYVTHQSPQPATAQQPGERPEMVFSAPVYTPNAGASGGQQAQPLSEMLAPAPRYQPQVPSQTQPYQSQYPAPQPAAPTYAAPPPPQMAPTPPPPAPSYATPTPQPAYAAPQSQQPAPTIQGYAPEYQMPGPITVRSAPQPAPPASDELRFQQESDTSRKLLAMEDQYSAAIKKLEAGKAARKAAILDQFENDAADPTKVIGLAERLRAAMAALEEVHGAALADEQRRYNNARLDAIASSPSRVQ